MVHKALTRRQAAILEFTAAGATNKEIAASMSISVAGVKKHLEALGRRYGVSRRTAVVRAAIESGDLALHDHRNDRPGPIDKQAGRAESDWSALP